MKRYHFFPQLAPKGVTFEMETLAGGKPNYQKMEKSWNNLIELMQQKWYRRLPWQLHEPWLSWEVYSDSVFTKYFLWASEEDFGANAVDRIAVENGEYHIHHASSAPTLDFSKPHSGIKLLLAEDCCLPLHIFRDETIDSQTAFLEFLSNLNGEEEVFAQFLVRPAYPSKIQRKFDRAQKKVMQNRNAPKGENENFQKAIAEKSQLAKAEVSIKLIAFASDQTQAHDLVDACASSLSYMSTNHLNRFETRNWWRMIRPLFRMELKRRIFPFRLPKNQMMLGVSELSGLLRMPSSAGTAKFIRLKMQRPVTPVVVRKFAHSDQPTVFLGENTRNLALFKVHFAIEEQMRENIAILGGAKTGKTTLLLNLLLGFIETRTEENRRGCTVVDLKGDLAQQLLERIPKEHHSALRVVRARDAQFPLNLFQVDFPLTQQGGHCVELLARVDGEHWNLQLQDMLTTGGLILDRVNQMSFLNLQRLFEERPYYQWVRDQLNPDDETERNMIQFLDRFYGQEKRSVDWRQEFMLSPAMSKLRGLNSSSIGPMLNTKTCGVHWNEAIEEGHIVIFDLSGLSIMEKKIIGTGVLILFELLMIMRLMQEDQGGRPPLHPLVFDDPTPFLAQGSPSFQEFVNSMRRANMPVVVTIPGIQEVLSTGQAEVLFRSFGNHFVYQLGNYADAEYACHQLSSETFGLTPEDFHLINPPYCYYQPSVKRDEVFHVKTRLPEESSSYNQVEELIAESVRRVRELESNRCS